MQGHYRSECIHGRVVEQCRCPGPKTVRVVDCPPSCDRDTPPRNDAVAWLSSS